MEFLNGAENSFENNALSFRKTVSHEKLRDRLKDASTATAEVKPLRTCIVR